MNTPTITLRGLGKTLTLGGLLAAADRRYRLKARKTLPAGVAASGVAA